MTKSTLEDLAEALFASSFLHKRDFTLIYSDALLQDWPRIRNVDVGGDWWSQYLRTLALGETPKSDESFSTSYDLEAEVRMATARLQVSRCFARTAWSITVRWEPPEGARPTPPANQRKDLIGKSWRASSKHHLDGAEGPFLFSIREVVEEIWSSIDVPDNPSTGLILVAGSTAAAKSSVSRGLALCHLDKKLVAEKQENKRRPHLLTFEDPIEQYIWTDVERRQIFGEPGGGSPAPAMVCDAGCPLHVRKESQMLEALLKVQGELPIDYTPRRIPHDCSSIRRGLLMDALRQTPTLTYVGEVRNRVDMEACVDFAGTGHLLIATTHAGTLIEATRKIFESKRAHDSPERAIWAPRIHSVVHLTEVEWGGHNGFKSPIVPAVYRRSPNGLQSLIADGLGSLLPHAPVGEDKSVGSLGRQYFGRRLCRRSLELTGVDKCSLKAVEAHTLRESLKDASDPAFDVLDLCREKDLKGE